MKHANTCKYKKRQCVSTAALRNDTARSKIAKRNSICCAIGATRYENDEKREREREREREGESVSDYRHRRRDWQTTQWAEWIGRGNHEWTAGTCCAVGSEWLRWRSSGAHLLHCTTAVGDECTGWPLDLRLLNEMLYGARETLTQSTRRKYYLCYSQQIHFK